MATFDRSENGRRQSPLRDERAQPRIRSQATIREYQRIRYVLRLAAQNIALLRLHIRLRDARLRIKYKFPPIGERAKAPSRHAWEVRANTSFPSPLVGEGHRPVGSVARCG